MTWHYQAVRYPSSECGIHEFYRIGDSEGITQDAVGVVSETRWGLLRVLLRMACDVVRHGEMFDPDTRWTLTEKGRAAVGDT